VRSADSALDLQRRHSLLNIDHYTFLRQAIFKVKDVPMFYVPVMYFQPRRMAAATGFLIPTYGFSTIRGQAIHQRLLLGDRSQPGRHIPVRLVFEDRNGGRNRIPIQPGRRIGWSDHGLSTRPACGNLPDVAGFSTLPAERSFTVNGQRQSSVPLQPACRARINYSPASRPTRHSTRT